MSGSSARQQRHEPVDQQLESALVIFAGEFLEHAPRDHAAPVREIVDLFHLEAHERVRAHHVNRQQLEQLLREYVDHYNTHRAHRSLGQRAPNNAEVVAYRPGQPIRRHLICDGLINEYRHAA